MSGGDEAVAATGLPAPFLDNLVRPLFAEPRRAALATELLGAPLAAAARLALDGSPISDTAALPPVARVGLVEAAATRHAALSCLASLRDAGIEHVAIKGLAAAYTLYPHPGLRPLPDVDILVRQSDLAALVAHLKAAHFATVEVPGATRRWGALTISSFAAAAPPDGAFLIDVHVAVDDPPASAGVPAHEIFEASREVETEGGPVRMPGREHMLALLILNAFRDLYEPRGLKSLFDAALLLADTSPDLEQVAAMARRGAFRRRAVFYRELCALLGVGDVSGLLPGHRLGPHGRRLVSEVADNMRSITLLRFSDTRKLAFEMALYDSPMTTLRRNAGRILGLVRPRSNALPDLPVAETA